MNDNIIAFRVVAKTEPGAFRIIGLDPVSGMVICDCTGVPGQICAHIDAVLLCGERAMVHPSDFGIADKAQTALAGRYTLSALWKASWKRNLGWRGLETYKEPMRSKLLGNPPPVVCLIGNWPLPRPKREYRIMARENGWESCDEFNPSASLIVSADTSPASALRVAARKAGIPVVSYADWEDVCKTGEVQKA